MNRKAYSIDSFHPHLEPRTIIMIDGQELMLKFWNTCREDLSTLNRLVKWKWRSYCKSQPKKNWKNTLSNPLNSCSSASSLHVLLQLEEISTRLLWSSIWKGSQWNSRRRTCSASSSDSLNSCKSTTLRSLDKCSSLMLQCNSKACGPLLRSGSTTKPARKSQ